MVDDSQIVGQLMIYICSQMGIANYEEYSLIHDLNENEKEKTLTLKKQHDKTLNRDYKKMEELKKKLHTEDDSKNFEVLAVANNLIDSKRNFFLPSCMARSFKNIASTRRRRIVQFDTETKVFLL